ncbi:MAG: hypothetical protein CMJ46_14920 [Planctomyces sp.]|nr:hypothetical protein [Planctomyces sp.]
MNPFDEKLYSYFFGNLSPPFHELPHLFFPERNDIFRFIGDLCPRTMGWFIEFPTDAPPDLLVDPQQGNVAICIACWSNSAHQRTLREQRPYKVFDRFTFVAPIQTNGFPAALELQLNRNPNAGLDEVWPLLARALAEEQLPWAYFNLDDNFDLACLVTSRSNKFLLDNLTTYLSRHDIPPTCVKLGNDGTPNWILSEELIRMAQL